MARAEGGLATVAEIARLLNAGLAVEDTLVAAVETLRARLPARRITIWMRQPGGTTFRAVSAPPDPAARPVGSLDALPLTDTSRPFPLEHDATRVGLLVADLDASPTRLALLEIVADLLAPHLASLELSEDLAVEVAAQTREIDEHRRLTSLIIDSLPVGLYVVDRDYRIQTWNRKRETGTQGLRRGEVVGRPVFEVLTRQDAEQLRAEFDRVFETGEIQQSEQEVVLAGKTRHFRLSKIPMRLEGDEITHVITIGEDVTDWHAIQGQITQSDKLAALGQLAAGVMHEINNPLATISACVAAIQGRLPEVTFPGQDTVAEYLEIIDKEVDRCTRIVDGLLDFSRPKAKTKGPVAPNRLVEEALFLLQHHPQFKRIAVVRELDAEVLETQGSREQLIQALLALMLNALDAMEQGGQLTVRTRRGLGREGEILIEVEDTGIGIPRADQGKIFEPFFTTKPPGRGTGLGLSICYGIVEQHRGRIEVESVPGKGSLFRVVLPAHRDETAR